MREILFRGKVTAEYAANHPLLSPGDWVNGSGMLALKDSACIFCDGGTERVPVDPDTVCQFTGLRDRNGVRIFEGDILNDGFGCMRVVWENGAFGMSAKRGMFIHMRPERDCDRGYIEHAVKVVGNVYDNPEFGEWEE